MTDTERSRADLEKRITQKRAYLLSFEGISEAEANRYAAELRDTLLRILLPKGAPTKFLCSGSERIRSLKIWVLRSCWSWEHLLWRQQWTLRSEMVALDGHPRHMCCF